VGVVLRVAELRQTQSHLQQLQLGASFSRLGNSVTDIELQLTGTHLCTALDLRFSESPAVRSFYREGTHAILADTIRSIQNERVSAGDNPSDTAIDSRTLQGDCWSEVKAMGVEKIRGARGSSSAVASSNYIMRE